MTQPHGRTALCPSLIGLRAAGGAVAAASPELEVERVIPRPCLRADAYRSCAAIPRAV